MTQVTGNILVLFSIMLISFLAKQLKLMPKGTIPVLTALLFNITLPALIFTSITTGPGLEVLKESLPLVSIAVAYCLSTNLVAGIILKRLAAKDKSAGVLAFASIFSNTSFVGLPLCYLIFGQAGVVLGSLYDFVQTLFMFTSGIMFLGGSRGGLLEVIGDQLKEPPVLSLIAGLVVLLTGLKIPTVVMEPLKMLGDVNTVLAMFAIGQYLELKCFLDFSRLKKLLPLVLTKLLILPFAVLGIITLIPLTSQIKGVLTIMVASPTAILAAVLAEKYKLDYELGVMAVVATTGLSIITIPMILSFL